MPDFDNFGHFFAVMCHINFAGLLIIGFFFKHVHKDIQQNIEDTLLNIKITEISNNDDFGKQLNNLVGNLNELNPDLQRRKLRIFIIKDFFEFQK